MKKVVLLISAVLLTALASALVMLVADPRVLTDPGNETAVLEPGDGTGSPSSPAGVNIPAFTAGGAAKPRVPGPKQSIPASGNDDGEDDFPEEDMPPLTVEGLVLAASSGLPLPGSLVRSCIIFRDQDDCEEVRFLPLSETSTSAAGAFTLAPVPYGSTVLLTASSPGYEIGQMKWDAYPRGEPPVFRLRKGAVVRGRVITPEGKPAAAAKTVAMPGVLEEMAPRQLARLIEESLAFLVSAVCDADGRYRMDDLPCDCKEPLIVAFGVGGEAGWATAVEDAAGDADLRADIRLLGNCTLQVWVFSPDGAAVPDVPLILLDSGGVLIADQHGVPRFAETGEDGSCTVGFLPAGDIVVETWIEGCAPVRASTSLKPASTTRLDIRNSTGLEVSGVVQDVQGAPLEGVQLDVFPGLRLFMEKELVRDGVHLRPGARTDHLGRFVISGLPQGKVRLVASGSRGFCAEEAVVEAGSDNVRIVMKKPAVFSGVIQLAPGRKPPDITVLMLGNPGYALRGLETGPAGQFELEWPFAEQSGKDDNPFLKPGEILVFFRISDWPEIRLGPFRPGKGEEVSLGLITRPHTRILSGTVTSLSGQPLHGAKVSFIAPPSRVKLYVDARDGGGFEMKCTPQYRGILWASHPDYPDEPMEIGPEDAGPFHFQLGPGSTVRCRVLDAFDVGVAGCDVELRAEGFLGEYSPTTRSGETDAQGAAMFRLVRPGRHRVFVRSPDPGLWGFEADWIPGQLIEVKAGDEKTVDFKINK